MNKKQPINVLVTGVGAIIGQGIVKGLKACEREVRIVGVDRDAEGPGRHWCDTFFAKPGVSEDSQDYVDFWLNLLSDEQIDLVMPGLEVDVQFLNSKRTLLASTGTKIALNNAALITQTADKWQFGEYLAAKGFARIPATLERTWKGCCDALGAPPFLLKPRKGNGSRGIVRIESEEELMFWTRKSGSEFLIQKFVGNDNQEFTAGAFGLGQGRTLRPIVFRRRLSVAGNTQFAEVVFSQSLEEEIKRLASHFEPVGPTNYQFRVDGGKNYLLEINPRFSSSTSLRAEFGYNEAAMSLNYYLDGVEPVSPNIKEGKGWRYFADLVAK